MKLRIVSLLLSLMLVLFSGCGTAPAGSPTARTAAGEDAQIPEDPGEEMPEGMELGAESFPEELAKAKEEPQENEELEETEEEEPPEQESRNFPTAEAFGFSRDAAGAMAENGDVVGWLYVPSTDINDPIVQSDDNSYYLRRGLDGRTANDGSYFADYRCIFDGGLSHNTVIYGNSFSEDPDDTLFSQLKRYYDLDFASQNPYIYFSTLDADYLWEVCAVLVTDIAIPYNVPDQDPESQQDILNYFLEESLHHFGIDLRLEDHLLILSTNDYSRDFTYPNNNRFVLVARLVAD